MELTTREILSFVIATFYEWLVVAALVFGCILVIGYWHLRGGREILAPRIDEAYDRLAIRLLVIGPVLNALAAELGRRAVANGYISLSTMQWAWAATFFYMAWYLGRLWCDCRTIRRSGQVLQPAQA